MDRCESFTWMREGYVFVFTVVYPGRNVELLSCLRRSLETAE